MWSVFDEVVVTTRVRLYVSVCKVCLMPVGGGQKGREGERKRW
jgi:hypothetical protein